MIAGCGHKFFTHKGFTSSLELSEHGRVFFIDYYTKKRIYTHDRKYDNWPGFTSGDTLRRLIERLRDFITKGETMNQGYFQPKMDNGFENPWGYGKDILKVKKAAIELGIAS